MAGLGRGEGGGGAELRGQDGVGGGAIVAGDGFILTNTVLARAGDAIRVITHDGEVHPAIVVKRDRKMDVALIKIVAKDLKPAALGDSDKVTPGQWVLVAGNPFGVATNPKDTIAVNHGVVSAKGKVEAEGYRYEGSVIQTDAAINQGAFGGAVVNLQGDVVGVASRTVVAKSTKTKLNVAIPINRLKEMMWSGIEMYNELVKTDPSLVPKFPEKPKGYFGAAIMNEAESKAGAFVQVVAPVGPAKKAGLKANDMIVAVDGNPVPNGKAMLDILADTEAGQRLTLKVKRGDKELTMLVTLADPPKAVIQ